MKAQVVVYHMMRAIAHAFHMMLVTVLVIVPVIVHAFAIAPATVLATVPVCLEGSDNLNLGK